MSGSSGVDCRFETERLKVIPWRDMLAEPDRKRSLIEWLRKALVPAVTRHLPLTWHIDPATEDFELWITARLSTSAIMQVSERETGEMVGVFILPGAQEKMGATLRIGYVLAQAHWGQSYATELVRGAINWAAGLGVERLIAGVERDNRASSAVLVKAGFEPAGLAADGVDEYVLVLQSTPD